MSPDDVHDDMTLLEYMERYGDDTGEGEEGENSDHNEPEQDGSNPDPVELPDYSDDEGNIRTVTPLPFPRERENLSKNEYLFLNNDALNFQDKSKHGGPTLRAQIELISNLTGNFSTTEIISDPTRAGLLCKSNPNCIGHLCANIRKKISENERLSKREKHYIELHKNWLYTDVGQEVSMSLCAELKAISTEEIETNNWMEVQRERSPKDCTGCLTEHATIGGVICSRRNLNGPVNCDLPLVHGNWRAAMIGVFSYLTLPWCIADAFLNVSITDPAEYFWDTHIPLDMEVNYQETPLGRAIMKRISLMRSNKRLPLYIEFCHHKANSDKSYLEILINFLKVIKSIQKSYLAPIVVLMSLATPHKKHTTNTYNNLKRDYIRKSSIAQVVAHCLGVPFIEIIVQRRPTLTGDMFQWNNSDRWNMDPLFNRNMQYTNEMNQRIAANLRRIAMYMSEAEVPRNLDYYESEEINEPWS